MFSADICPDLIELIVIQCLHVNREAFDGRVQGRKPTGRKDAVALKIHQYQRKVFERLVVQSIVGGKQYIEIQSELRCELDVLPLLILHLGQLLLEYSFLFDIDYGDADVVILDDIFAAVIDNDARYHGNATDPGLGLKVGVQFAREEIDYEIQHARYARAELCGPCL